MCNFETPVIILSAAHSFGTALMEADEEKKVKKTRKSAEVFGLGQAITEDDFLITGARLPTYRQVLRCLMYHTQPDKKTKINKSRWEAAKAVLSQVREFYKKAGRPIITERKACERIIAFLDENSKIRNIPMRRRESRI